MFANPSLITRIAIAKAVGFLAGLAGFFMMPAVFGETDLMVRWAFVFWYTTVGAFIGVFGVMTWHPVLKLPMPWWFRSAFIGAWMNFLLTLFIYERMQGYMDALFGQDGLLSSPFWFVSEGVLIGLLMGYLATRFGGEGKATVDR
ncbi:MAG: hypothetical protein HKN15_03305 [Xanthomonadales bacterium]|nr:hypothetical protein [Xanthomonadales bacterium]